MKEEVKWQLKDPYHSARAIEPEQAEASLPMLSQGTSTTFATTFIFPKAQPTTFQSIKMPGLLGKKFPTPVGTKSIGPAQGASEGKLT